MASNPYVKSLIWLVSFGGIGYGLMLLTEPSAEKIERIKSSGPKAHLTDAERKTELLMKKLQEAATSNAPVYPSAGDKK